MLKSLKKMRALCGYFCDLKLKFGYDVFCFFYTVTLVSAGPAEFQSLYGQLISGAVILIIALLFSLSLTRIRGASFLLYKLHSCTKLLSR